ncbi:carboxylating nicotinate-nucleotide diphosphorylase, partial [bacterium]
CLLVAKEDTVLAGLPAFLRVFSLLEPESEIKWSLLKKEGEEVKKGETILEGEGNSRLLLTGERTALNILQRLCGIAQMSRRWSAELSGAKTLLVDTRKTTPGIRALEKYAVRVGGAKNHRFGLYDGVLIKENHIRAAGSIKSAVAGAKKGATHLMKIEVEVTNLDEVEEALAAGADALLLDNMDNETMARAVTMTGAKALTEASGNMSLERLKEVAATGVDFISAGALTHSVKAADLSLLFV